MKNAHRQDSGQCCVCACTVDNLFTHKAEHALKMCSDTKLRLFWFQHDQILTGHARKTDTVLTALFHLLAVPCSNEVHPYRKSAGHWRRNRSDQLKWLRDSDWRVNMWQLWSFRESSVLIPDGGKRKRRKYFTPNIYTPLCWHFSDLNMLLTQFSQAIVALRTSCVNKLYY